VRPGFGRIAPAPHLAFILVLAWNGWASAQVPRFQPARVRPEPPLFTPDLPKDQLQETEGYVPVEGGRLYYREAGQGPAVILIHGGYLDLRMWDDQVAVLATAHRVVRYDVRFHGRSTSEEVPFSDMADLGVLMDSLEIPSATIVGLSMGGQIAVDFALMHPERVGSLVLVAPGLSGFPFGSPELGAYMEAITDAIGRDDFPEMIEIFTRYWCDGPKRTPEEVDPEVRSKVLEMLAGSWERWGRSPLVQQLDPPAMNRVSSIHAPTLLVVGSVDMPDIQEVVAHLVANIPGALRVDIPDVAHMVNLEAPERFNEILLEFLRGG
jgi:3-oxoadipate enol-lactonase